MIQKYMYDTWKCTTDINSLVVRFTAQIVSLNDKLYLECVGNAMEMSAHAIQIV